MEDKYTRDSEIIDLCSHKVDGGSRKARKGGYGGVNCNPRCFYCPLVPKRDTFCVTDGSPMTITDRAVSIKCSF